MYILSGQFLNIQTQEIQMWTSQLLITKLFFTTSTLWDGSA